MTVLDASVVFSALVDDGPYGNWCMSVAMRRDAVAPEFLPAEVMSVMRRAVLVGRLPDERAVVGLSRMAGMDLEMMSFWPVSERVWELRATVSVYDAWYVAIAEATGRPLATLDRRLVAAPGPRCEFLTPAAT